AVPAQFIFTMHNLRRFYPPDREVLRGINISMFPGAKIGVLGSNGSGKSSLLRIMAGEDDGYTGEARLTPGFTVGHLPQEPQLDPTKDVLGNVAEGMGETKRLVDRFNEVCESMGDPDADFDKLLAEQAELQLDWIRMSPRARQAKGRARYNAYDALVAEAEAAEGRGDKLEIMVPPGPRLGDVVVEASGLVKGFGERLLIDGLEFSLPPGG